MFIQFPHFDDVGQVLFHIWCRRLMGGGISLNLQSSAQPAPASVNESVSIAPEQLAAQASCLSNLEAVTRQTARKGPPGSFTID